jgi:hypothetical protein
VAVEQARKRPYPHVRLDRAVIERLLGCSVLDAQLLDGGLRNTNYRVRLGNAPHEAVLRLYTADATACAREASLLEQVVPTERLYVLSLGSQQGNRHVHGHAAPLPPGVPYREQQLAALQMSRGLVPVTPDQAMQLARQIRARLVTEPA